jgi:hypothetical protein
VLSNRCLKSAGLAASVDFSSIIRGRIKAVAGIGWSAPEVHGATGMARVRRLELGQAGLGRPGPGWLRRP